MPSARRCRSGRAAGSGVDHGRRHHGRHARTRRHRADTADGIRHDLQYSWPRRHITVRTGAFGPPRSRRSCVPRSTRSTRASRCAVTTAEQMVTDRMARHRLVMLALVVFGAVALVLCISGLYAVIVLNSQQRRREYAIRVALGAGRGGVRWMVVRQALVLAAPARPSDCSPPARHAAHSGTAAGRAAARCHDVSRRRRRSSRWPRSRPGIRRAAPSVSIRSKR